MLRYLLFLLSPTLLCAQIQFSDQSVTAGINSTGMNRGAAVVDFDGDGWEDIYVSRLDGPNKLFRNLGNGQFADVAPSAGLAHTGQTVSSAWGDLDNDGDPDVVLGNRLEPSLVFRNEGNGTFTDITTEMGVYVNDRVQCVLLADIDNDSDLDLYFANLGTENYLYRNERGVYMDVTVPFGATDKGIAMGALFFDYDNDGDQDLYLTHDANQPNILYQNQGDGRFRDVSVSSGLNFAGQGMGVDAGDINGDGYLDVYITNLYENALFLNQQDGTFEEISTSAGVTDIGMGWGTFFFDCDNDGWQDIYVSNETPFLVYNEAYPNLLYRNRGDLTFEIESNNTPLESYLGGYAAVCADFNKDGLSDIFVANTGKNSGNELFINEGIHPYRWVGFNLIGTESNRSAIGARVEVRAGEELWADQVIGASGFAGQNSLKLHFGLGLTERIDSVTVFWPSGKVETFVDLELDRVYVVEEGGRLVTNTTHFQRSIDLRVYPNPTSDHLTIEWADPDVNLAGPIRLYNAIGQMVRTWFTSIPFNQGRVRLTDLHYLPAGAYWLEVATDRGPVAKRIQLQ